MSPIEGVYRAPTDNTSQLARIEQVGVVFARVISYIHRELFCERIDAAEANRLVDEFCRNRLAESDALEKANAGKESATGQGSLPL